MHFLCQSIGSPNFALFLTQVKSIIPTVHCLTAVIQIAGNDIDYKCCTLVLASKLEEFADWLR